MKTIFSLSLKVMGIYSLVQAIVLLQGFSIFIASYSNFAGEDINIPAMYIAALLPICFLIILCFILLIFSDSIATKLKITDEQFDPNKCLKPKDLQSVAFSVVGVIVFLLAVINIVRQGSSIIAVFKQLDDTSKLLNTPYIVALVFQLILGAGLFFGAKPLTMFWHRLKYEWKSSRDET